MNLEKPRAKLSSEQNWIKFYLKIRNFVELKQHWNWNRKFFKRHAPIPTTTHNLLNTLYVHIKLATYLPLHDSEPIQSSILLSFFYPTTCQTLTPTNSFVENQKFLMSTSSTTEKRYGSKKILFQNPYLYAVNKTWLFIALCHSNGECDDVLHLFLPRRRIGKQWNETENKNHREREERKKL